MFFHSFLNALRNRIQGSLTRRLLARRLCAWRKKAARRFFFERLETRVVLASDWQNPLWNLDVDFDGTVSPLDALVPINEINRQNGGGPKIDFKQPVGENNYLDVDGDLTLSPLDVLNVVNYLNASKTPLPTNLSLSVDSGASANDRITNTPIVNGLVTNTSPLKPAVKARLDRGAVVPVTLSSNNTFVFDASSSSPVLDGNRFATVFVQSDDGGIGYQRLQFTLDTVAPLSSVFGIDPSDDSGRSASDGVTRTNRPKVNLATEPNTSLQIMVGTTVLFNGITAGSFSQATSTLADGTRQLNASLTDIAGNTRQVTRTITIDTTAPAIPRFDLSASSDTGVVGDRTTRNSRVTILGTTEANSFVSLNGSVDSFRTAGDGNFTIPSVTLNVGTNNLQLSVSDLAGNTNNGSQSFTRVNEAATADPVLTWNQAIINAIQLDATTPPVATRGMAMMSIAMLDTLNSIEKTPSYLVSLPAPDILSTEAAMSTAAYEVLKYLYPAQQQSIDAVQANVLGSITDATAKANGVAFGTLVADAVITLRKQDGWDRFVDYTPSSSVGEWQQTAPMYDQAQLPQWGDLTPFGVSDIDAIIPSGPPSLTSDQWPTAFNEVKSLGSATSTTRNADQTQQARFWADGSGTATPPGHWNQIATQIATDKNLSLGENARLFATLNIAMSDSSIAAWKTKYAKEFWRPITAIREADTDSNAATAVDPNWSPLLITPPHPEYVSGHSTYSAAAARVLANYFGDNQSFTTTSPGLANVTRSYTSFSQAAAEAGRSRIYGGIHYEFSNQDGLSLGRSVADKVIERFSLADDLLAPSIVFLSPTNNITTSTNPTIEGWVIDNLSGVASATVQVDNRASQPVSLNASDRFSFTPSLALNTSTNGSHTIRFTAIDKAGLQSSNFDFTFTLDTLAPTASITSPADGATITAGQLLEGTVSGTGSNLVSLTYQIDNGSRIPISFSSTGGSFSSSLDLSKVQPGSHTLKLLARDAAGLETAINRSFTISQFIPLTITDQTPSNGSSDIGSTFRPQVHFSRPINKSTLTPLSFYATDTTGTKLPATIVAAQDGSFAWLFFTSPMPGSSTITVYVDGDIITGLDGKLLDADGNGAAGGKFTYSFTTVSLSSLPNTSIKGRVVDPGVDLKAMTRDDILAGSDGILHTSDDVFLSPIVGAKVFILGRESQSVTTDSQGFFELTSVPAGTIKLAVDGRTATNAPSGVFWPEMVMDLELIVGSVNTVMGTMGTREERAANLDRTEVYLPRLQTSILKPISNTTTTTVGVDSKSSPNLTNEQRSNLKLEVVPNSILGENGQPLANAQIGISTVPPELVRDMLPPGLLQHTFDITIQAPGAATFNTPLQMTFPNVFNAAPGTKLNFLSFDHTTGRLVIEGTATVSADGLSVTTDAGNGITKPGWHGLTPPGSELTGKTSKNQESYDASEFAELEHPVFSSDILKKIRDRGSKLQRFDDDLTAGPVVRDKHEVTVRMPNGVSPEDFLKDMLRDFNGTIDFDGFDSQAIFSRNPNPQIGDVFSIDLPYLPYDANVMLTKEEISSNSGRWWFTTITTPLGLGESLNHPSSGTREFGFQRDLTTGNVTFYTKSPSRATNAAFWAGENVLGNGSYTAQDWAWQQMVTGIGRKIENLGGSVPQSSNAANPSSSIVRAPLGFMGSRLGSRDSRDSAVSVAVYRIQFETAKGEISELSGIVMPNGSIPRSFLPANSNFRLAIFEPDSGLIGEVTGETSSSGVPTDLRKIGLTVKDVSDGDSDGISDFGEFVFGTDPHLVSSLADGISDSVRLSQLLSASTDGSFPGVVSSTDLQSSALKVKVLSSGTSLLAYVLTSTPTIEVVQIDSSNKVSRLNSLRLPAKIAKSMSFDSTNNLLVVSTDAGLLVVDLTDGRMPTALSTIPVASAIIEAFNGVAYVAIDGALVAYDILSGELLQNLNLGLARITGLCRDGSTIYSMDANRLLRAIDVSSFSMINVGSLAMPQGGGSVFVGNGIAYVSATSLSTGGFATADVSDPNNLKLIAAASSSNNSASPNPDIVANGSGLGIMAVGGGQGVGPSLNVFDVRDPTKTNQFVTSFSLNRAPESVTVAGGLAYVASGSDGLQIVNYLPFDNKKIAPTASIDVGSLDTDPTVAGIQVNEGRSISIKAIVNDDVQVRSVDLLVDSVVVQSTLSFPFNLSANLPRRTESKNSVSVQVRGTDTGGNTTTSAPVTLLLVPDTNAPVLDTVFPSEGARRLLGPNSIRLQFSEPIDAATINALTLRLRAVGSTQDFVPTSVQLRASGTEAVVTYNLPLLGNYNLTVKRDGIRDRAGNAVGGVDITRSFAVVEDRDPGDTIATATNIGQLAENAYRFADRIGNDLIGDEDPVDVFQFSLASASDVTLSLSDLSEQVRTELYIDVDGDGQFDNNEILESSAFSPAGQFIEPLGAGTYFIRLTPSIAGRNSAYSLSVSATPILGAQDAGNTASSARDLGTLMSSSQILFDTVQTGDEDFYQFQLATTSTVIGTLTGLSEAVKSLLYFDSNSDGILTNNEITVSRDTANSQDFSGEYAAGTYFLRFIPSGTIPIANNTAYTLNLLAVIIPGAQDAPPTIAQARDMGTIGTTAVAARDQIQIGDVDVFMFTISSDRNLTAAFTGITASIQVDLYVDGNSDGNFDGNELIESASPSSAFSFAEPLSQGTFYIRVAPSFSSTNTGYSLVLFSSTLVGDDTQPDPGPNFAGARDMGTLNATPVTTLDTVRTFDLDAYKFSLATDQTLSASFTGISELLYVQLYFDGNNDGVPNGNEEIENAALNGDLTMTEPLSAGTYYLIVSPYYNDRNSAFRLTLSAVGLAGDDTQPDPGPNIAGARDMGTLNATPVTTLDTVRAFDDDVYRFDLAAAGTLNATFSRISERSWIQLYSDADNDSVFDGNELIEEQTPSGDFTLRRALAAGTYYIRIRSYSSDSNSAFKLDLSVT